MQIRTIINDTGRTLRIWANESLDLQQHDTFSKAAIVASYTLINDIEIDLQNTRIIRDSGLALLLMLRRKTRQRNGSMRLINCPAELQTRFSNTSLAGDLRIA
ncbi:MAG: hypothetical protein R3F42_03050 [Pseudomonadota bacterium]